MNIYKGVLEITDIPKTDDIFHNEQTKPRFEITDAEKRYFDAIQSIGGESYWNLKEHEEWFEDEYGTEMLQVLKIASGVE